MNRGDCMMLWTYLKTNSILQNIHHPNWCSFENLKWVISTPVDETEKAQSKDAQCKRILNNKMSAEDTVQQYQVRDGIVVIYDRCFIPLDVLLKHKLLRVCHDNSGRAGRQKAYELVNRLCHWLNMFRDVCTYIQQCTKCQQNKPSNYAEPFDGFVSRTRILILKN